MQRLSTLIIVLGAVLIDCTGTVPALSQPAATQPAPPKLRPIDKADAEFHAQYKKAFQNKDPNRRQLLSWGLQQGYPSAYAEAGAIYLDTGDTARGMAMIRSAAEAGLPSAMALLGLTLLSSSHPAEGRDWIIRAARLGDTDALAICDAERLKC